MEFDAQLVIGPDGIVLAAAGELPPGLVDARLEDCVGLSREIREAGKALLHQLSRSGTGVDGDHAGRERSAVCAIGIWPVCRQNH
jgi:hypothetical protein